MGSIYNMTLTLYKEPEFKMEFNENLNALCFTAQDLTIDLDMPYFRLNVETQKQQVLDLNFDLDYYVNEGLDVYTCLQFVTIKSNDSVLPGVSFIKTKAKIKTQRAKARVDNLLEGSDWGIGIQALRQTIMHDINDFAQLYIEEIITEVATSNINKKIKSLMPNGYFAPFRTTKGLENIALNAEVY